MELQDAKHRLGMLHDMVWDGEALRTENDKLRTCIKELWADIKSMKLSTILAIARIRQYESEFESIMEEWNQNSRLRSLFLTSWPLEETMYMFLYMIMPSMPVTIPFAVVFAIWIIEIHTK